MIKKTYILTLILVGFFSFSAIGQNSAQATMKVSARVISGPSVEVDRNFDALNHNSFSEVGVFTLKGINKDSSIRISSSKTISLSNLDGHEVFMNIGSWQLNNGSNRSIYFNGEFEGEMISSAYQGELKTTIEYL